MGVHDLKLIDLVIENPFQALLVQAQRQSADKEKITNLEWQSAVFNRLLKGFSEQFISASMPVVTKYDWDIVTAEVTTLTTGPNLPAVINAAAFVADNFTSDLKMGELYKRVLERALELTSGRILPSSPDERVNAEKILKKYEPIVKFVQKELELLVDTIYIYRGKSADHEIQQLQTISAEHQAVKKTVGELKGKAESAGIHERKLLSNEVTLAYLDACEPYRIARAELLTQFKSDPHFG